MPTVEATRPRDHRVVCYENPGALCEWINPMLLGACTSSCAPAPIRAVRKGFPVLRVGLPTPLSDPWGTRPPLWTAAITAPVAAMVYVGIVEPTARAASALEYFGPRKGQKGLDGDQVVASELDNFEECRAHFGG